MTNKVLATFTTRLSDRRKSAQSLALQAIILAVYPPCLAHYFYPNHLAVVTRSVLPLKFQSFFTSCIPPLIKIVLTLTAFGPWGFLSSFLLKRAREGPRMRTLYEGGEI